MIYSRGNNNQNPRTLVLYRPSLRGNVKRLHASMTGPSTGGCDREGRKSRSGMGNPIFGRNLAWVWFSTILRWV